MKNRQTKTARVSERKTGAAVRLFSLDVEAEKTAEPFGGRADARS
jgi:hypothetical protein